MAWETMDEEWTGRETVDEALGDVILRETSDEALGDMILRETVDEALETIDETSTGTWEESMEATRDEEAAAGSNSPVKKKKSRSPAPRVRQQIESRHIKMLVRELLPYVILVASIGIMVSGALAFRRTQTERMAREVLQEYEEQFLHE